MEPGIKNVHCLSGMSGACYGQESRTPAGLGKRKTNKVIKFSKIVELVIE